MSGDVLQLAGRTWEPGDSGPLPVAILFMDLVGSSDAASIMGLEEFANYSSEFERVCDEQTRYFFEILRRDRYGPGERNYSVQHVGDEQAVFVHTDRPHDDVYQLTCLAIALKCAWLSLPLNADRIASGRPTFEIAGGLHWGKVWATYRGDGFEHRGFAINVAKRVESASREGDRFRIFVSDAAHKRVNRRLRNLVFGPRRLLELKGVAGPTGVHELRDAFVDSTRRMPEHLAKAFLEVGLAAMDANSLDLWVHSCLQVARAREAGRIDDDMLDLCERTLTIDPVNPVALYHAAQARKERGEPEIALLYLEDLTRHWPALGDGWLERGRLLDARGDAEGARVSYLQALRYGIEEVRELLPANGTS